MKPIELLPWKSVDWVLLYDNQKVRIVSVNIVKENQSFQGLREACIKIFLRLDDCMVDARFILDLKAIGQITKNVAELVDIPAFTFEQYHDILTKTFENDIICLHIFEDSNGFDKLNLLTDVYWLWVNDKYE